MNPVSTLMLAASLVLLSACATTGSDKERQEELQINQYKGKAYMERQNPQMALAPLRKVQEIEPDNVENLILLGHAYFLLERPLQAQATLQRVLELKPGSGEVHSRMGLVLLRLDRLDEARNHFLQASKDPLYLKPEEAYYYLALIEKSRSNSPAMVEWLEKALQMKPDHLPSHLELAGYHHFKGSYEKEQDHLNAILAVEPNDGAILERLATSYKSSGDLLRYHATKQKLSGLAPKQEGRVPRMSDHSDGKTP